MEQIYLIRNDDLQEVNMWLQKGGRVKSIHAISENVAAYGYAGGQSYNNREGSFAGNIYAYVVIEFD